MMLSREYMPYYKVCGVALLAWQHSDGTPCCFHLLASASVKLHLLSFAVMLAITGETDWVAAMATVACELHCTFDHYHWTVSNTTPCTRSATCTTLQLQSHHQVGLAGFLSACGRSDASDRPLPGQPWMPANSFQQGRVWGSSKNTADTASARRSPVPRSHCMCFQVSAACQRMLVMVACSLQQLSGAWRCLRSQPWPPAAIPSYKPAAAITISMAASASQCDVCSC